jgi:predicted P-loop ATPase
MSAADTQEVVKKSVTAYLGTLVWDGIPRIERWLIEYAAAEDSSYVRSASRAMLVAAVRRARQPGCRFDQMPILDGPQGCGKSAALRLLAVEDEWFADLPLLDGDVRRILEATAGKWIVEASELESLLKSGNTSGDDKDGGKDNKDDKGGDGAGDDDEEADDEDDDDDDEEEEEEEADTLPPAAVLKAFLSRSVDEARMAYQVERTRVPRQFVVVGTTAAEPYLKDSTGNRRIWPIRVGRFDLTRLAEVRDQLWAEASVAEANGESIDLVAAAVSA